MLTCISKHLRMAMKHATSNLKQCLHHLLLKSSWGGEFKKPETLACVAPGYFCTNSLSHYLNITTNTSVVLEELSAHLLLCGCIAVHADEYVHLRQSWSVCVLVICVHLPPGRSFTAISCPRKVTPYLLWPVLICTIRLADGEIDPWRRLMSIAGVCVCVSVVGAVLSMGQ